MKRQFKIAALAVMTSALLPATVLAQAAPARGHPLVGKWQWTVPQNKCTERYDLRADGTASVTSGKERTDNTFSVSPAPDKGGFYRLTMKATKDYGGKDCGNDEKNSTGKESTSYVLFDDAKNSYVVCAQPKKGKCFGPLQRVKE